MKALAPYLSLDDKYRGLHSTHNFCVVSRLLSYYNQLHIAWDMEILILSFYKATSSLFQGILHKTMEATLSSICYRLAYPATSCIFHPIPTRPALLRIIHVWNLDHCLHVYDGYSTNRRGKQVVKHLVKNSRLHGIVAF